MNPHPDLLWLDEITEAYSAEVGGKAWNLARTKAAGLPVPNGFAITAHAYRRTKQIDSTLQRQLEDAYAKLGGGLVAVRSSALNEDGAETSFAGQMTTILGVYGIDALINAVHTCWESLNTERAKAYRDKQGIAQDSQAMAVVVQLLVNADVAGVLFTQDPSHLDCMSIEASWGLGEAVVSGRVTPDMYLVNRETKVIQTKRLGYKQIRISAHGEQAVYENELHAFALADTQVSQLADLGERVETYYGEPRDIEWAIAVGQVYLLQARPITSSDVDRDAIRKEIIETLKNKADPKGTVWVRYNLSEILPEPTPMTWSIVQRLLAHDGGFGAMNRDFGATPDETLGTTTGFDLIAGRPMANLSELPRLQFRKPPLEYPFAKFKAEPRLALDPQPVLNPLRGGGLAIFRLPAIIWRLWKMTSIPRRNVDTFAEKFTQSIAPAFAAEAKVALAEDWSKLDVNELFQRLKTWQEKTLVTFAKDSLKPTVLAKLCWDALVELLRPKLGAEKAATAVAGMSLGAAPPEECDLAHGIQAFANGKITREIFVERFGHRCRNEMELSQPRWAEDPQAVDLLASGGRQPPVSSENERNRGLTPPARQSAEEVFKVLLAPLRVQAHRWLERMRTYMGLREAAKHYLLMGYAVIRKSLVMLDQKLGLHGDIFYLNVDEILNSANREAVSGKRKKRRRVELSLELPSVLFSDDLNAIGRPTPPPVGALVYQGIPLSAGVAEAPALVLSEPTTPPDEPFVLVCPSTDPAWVPLFARAKAVVMETGGVLSHGAIVAREFGLPAVAGLPDARRQFHTGQVLRVDGNTGTVVVV